MSWRRTCRDPEETRRLGEALGGVAGADDVIGLVGDLGAGKTLLVQGLASGLAVPPEVRITSPTFTLVNEYRGGRLTLFHADLYRVERAIELEEIGLDDAFEAGGVAAVEWCDRFEVLPVDHVRVEIAIGGPSLREVTVAGAGPRGRALADDWAAALR